MTYPLNQQIEAVKTVVTEKRRAGEASLADALQAALNTLVARAAAGGNVLPTSELEHIPQGPLTLYKQFEEEYHAFCQRELGARGKMDGAQGKALNSIIDYLKEYCRAKDEAGALASWKYLLSHWHQVPPFLAAQKNLTAINKYLMEILEAIRKANKPTPPVVVSAEILRKRTKWAAMVEDARRILQQLRDRPAYPGQPEHIAQAERDLADLESELKALY